MKFKRVIYRNGGHCLPRNGIRIIYNDKPYCRVQTQWPRYSYFKPQKKNILRGRGNVYLRQFRSIVYLCSRLITIRGRNINKTAVCFSNFEPILCREDDDLCTCPPCWNVLCGQWALTRSPRLPDSGSTPNNWKHYLVRSQNDIFISAVAPDPKLFPGSGIICSGSGKNEKADKEKCYF